MTENKKLKVIFEPGCFDEFDGTQEELDDMIAEIERMAQSGELFEDAIPLNEAELEELAKDDDSYRAVFDKIIDSENKRTLH